MGFFKKLSNVLSGNMERDDTQPKKKGNGDKQHAEIMAPQWLKIVQDCVILVNETTTPEVFFERYNLLIKTLENLSQLENCIKFTKLPSSDLRKVKLIQEDSTNDFIDRYAEKLINEIQKLTTEKSKEKRLENFDKTFSIYQSYLTDINKNKCAVYHDKIKNAVDIIRYNDPTVQQNNVTSMVDIHNPVACEKPLKKSKQRFDITTLNKFIQPNTSLEKAPGSFNWSIMVSFGNSTSSNYNKAKYLAQKSINYEEKELDGVIIHTAYFSDARESFIDFINLYEIVSGWKSTTCFINGNLVDKKTVGKIKYCYGDKCRSVKSDFCYGASYMTDNPFGCHRLQISRFNNPWWGYYNLENAHYALDRDKLMERIELTDATFSHCPAFDLEHIKKMALCLPLVISKNDFNNIIEKVNVYNLTY